MSTAPTGTGTRPPFAGTRPPRLSEVPAFTTSIARRWADVPVPVDLPAGTAAAAAAHRARLSQAFPGRTIVLAAGAAPTRNDDASYAFRADSSFVWLTGCQVEGAVLVLHAVPGGHDAVLHLPEPRRPGTVGFFSDAAHGELWVGPASRLSEQQEALGVSVEPLERLQDGRVPPEDALLARSVAERDLPGRPLEPSLELERELVRLRSVKDAWEVEQLRLAVDATVGGFAAVAAEVPAAIRDGLGERWLQGTFDRHARTFGNGPGYATIVGSGPHAPVLHWVRADGPIVPDALLLLDMGVEARSLYTADVTRTIPAGGRFSPVQRQVHDLVEAAHRAGLEQVRPGVEYLDFSFAAMEVIARGLHDWGLLPVSVDEALSPEGQQHRRYLACGIGHHLGLDVHDCSRDRPRDSEHLPLEPGVVMTVEPGLYFHAHDETLPPELRGIGARIEDDVLVTAEGGEVLSGALPIDADGLERFAREHGGAM